MSCCGSKKTVKPALQTTTPPQPQPVIYQNPQNVNQLYKTQNQIPNPINTSRLVTPASKINFSANGFQSQPMTQPQQFIQSKKVIHYVHDRTDRLQDYSNQINKAERSNVIMQNKILNYDLDVEGGVSKIPVINTFHYQSTLNHHFGHAIGNGQLNTNYDRNMGVSAYQSQLKAFKSNVRDSGHVNNSGWLDPNVDQDFRPIRNSGEVINPYASNNGQQFVM